MRVRATTGSLLIAISLCLFASIPTAAQQQKDWTWKDRDGKPRSRADLDEILKQHRLWVESEGKSGTRADLSGANLSGAFLSRADLRSADLHGADLTGAELFDADLSHAFLYDVKLRGALLGGANLSDAYLPLADLSGAYLPLADLSGAEVSGADLDRAFFEPKNLLRSEAMAYARGLELMTYGNNPGPLTQLRKQFQDTGFREQERAITCALNRHDADPSKLRASVEEKWKSVRGRYSNPNGIMPFKSFIEASFKWIAFDLTCQYGFSPGRPLRIVGLLWLLFSIVYAVFIHRPGKSGIYVVAQWWRGESKTRIIQIRPRTVRAAKWWKLPFLWLRREWRVLRAAMFFSLMSAFNIGFRDINFGRWLRLLTKREYDLKAVGWARTVSGFQSLLSVYLIALWVLSYFGRPFG